MQTSLNNYYCKNLILATGAWSNKLGKLLDLDIPIIPIRGQMWATKPLSPRLFNTFSFINKQKSVVYGIDTYMDKSETNNLGTLLSIPFKKLKKTNNSKFSK